jgi:hypothetical protein
VTTGSGGAMEVATAARLPLFAKEDSQGLGRLLARLVADPGEVWRLAAFGQEVALRDFSFDRMMDRWVTTLRQLHESSRRDQAARLGHAGLTPARV